MADFESFKPQVLLLAFNDLHKSERHYLGLYRLGTVAQSLPHRALILCDNKTVNQAYDLCREGHFDDYIVFWPLTFDSQRLFMAINHVLRDLATQAEKPALAEMAAQARLIADLEALLARSLVLGSERTAFVSQSLEQAQSQIGTAIDDFQNRLIADGLDGAVEVKHTSRLHGEIERLKGESVQQRFLALKEAMKPMNQWIEGLEQEVMPHIESARAIKSMATQLRPVILMVDDDSFVAKLVVQMLGSNEYEFAFASSGTKALAAIQKRRPSLILMDFQMPDLNGIEVTRRLKAMPSSADIPVIMLTGQSDIDVVQSSLRAGAADFIVKPFQKDLLLRKVSKFISQ